MVILIDGEGASGKTVLRSLLDSYPGLIVSPNNDRVIDGVLDDGDLRLLAGARAGEFYSTWLANCDITGLRRLLGPTGYYQLEQFAYDGHIELEIIPGHIMRVPFTLNFHEFDRLVIGSLQETRSWSYVLITETIFRSLARWLSPDGPVQDIVGIGFDLDSTRRCFLTEYPEGKWIYMVRRVEDVVASRLERGCREGDLNGILLSGKIDRIVCRQRFAKWLAKEHPERVLVVDFDDLVLDTERIMRNVAKFLRIEFSPVLCRPTLLGHPVETSDGRSYVGEVMENSSEILTPTELNSVLAAVGRAEEQPLFRYGWE